MSKNEYLPGGIKEIHGNAQNIRFSISDHKPLATFQMLTLPYQPYKCVVKDKTLFPGFELDIYPKQSKRSAVEMLLSAEVKV
jgi:hypothetical protein